LASAYLFSDPWNNLGGVRSNASVRSIYPLSRPLMSRLEASISGIYLHDGAAIDIHRKHDALKGSLYFKVDVSNGCADESAGQITQELLEVPDFRASSDFGWRSSRCPAVFCSFATSHSVYCRSARHHMGRTTRALLVSFLYFRSIS
jgi:hypothetical protein